MKKEDIFKSKEKFILFDTEMDSSDIFCKHSEKFDFFSTNNPNIMGQYFLYEIYMDVKYDSNFYGSTSKLCYPKLGIYLNSLPCDQTIEVEWVDFRRTWEWNTKYDYVYKDKTYKNYIGVIPTEINRLPLWNDQMFIYGVWDSKPNWKQLRQAYERTWWFHRTSDEIRDLQLNRLLK
jgi:hypothetical protein